MKPKFNWTNTQQLSKTATICEFSSVPCVFSHYFSAVLKFTQFASELCWVLKKCSSKLKLIRSAKVLGELDQSTIFINRKKNIIGSEFYTLCKQVVETESKFVLLIWKVERKEKLTKKCCLQSDPYHRWWWF